MRLVMPEKEWRQWEFYLRMPFWAEVALEG